MRVLPFLTGDLVDKVIHSVAARLRSQRWVWLLPLAVLYAMMHWPTARIEHIMEALVVLGVVAWAVRRPGNALIALTVFLPLQTIGFGFLLRAHVPTQILRQAGGLKELLALGILISALHALHVGRTRRGKAVRLDAIDIALLTYVAVVTLYLLSPGLFTLYPITGRWSVRLLAWRGDCGYVLLFFAVRHAPIPAQARKRFIQVLVAIVTLTVLLGFYQWLQPESWSHQVLVTGRQVMYQISVLKNRPETVSRNLAYVINIQPLRVGSIFLSPFDMADFLLIPLAIMVERIARNYRSHLSYVVCAGVVAVLFASRVRADALAAVIVAMVALIPTPNRPVAARLRLLGFILVAALVVVPSLRGTRFVNAEGGGQSNAGHVSEVRGGLMQLAHNPLGIGIGNVAGVGDRFSLATRQGTFTVDNAVLQVGDELGIQALVPWLIMVILIWKALGRTSLRSDEFTGGIRLAFLALFVAGMFHHVFLSFPVAWILWAAVGLALAAGGDAGAHAGAKESKTAAANIDRIDATPPGDLS